MNRSRVGIKPAENRTVLKTRGDVWAIVKTIVQADRESAVFTEELANRLRRPDTRATLREAWTWVRTHVRYVRDRAGLETIKSPGKTWEDGKGDCKAFSVFIGSLLQNWGIPYVYRVAFYDPAQPQSGHIYPVAIVDGQKIPVDAVHTRFGEEVRFWRAYDVDPATGARTQLSGLGTFTRGNGFMWGLALVGIGVMFLRNR